MASIFDKAKKLATKISDEMNKGKWDSNVVNTALFNYEDPYKNKASGGAGSAAGAEAEASVKPAEAVTGNASVQPSAIPAQPAAAAASQPASVPVQSVAAVSSQPAAAADKPQPASVQDSAAAGYVKPVFRSRFGGPGGYTTSKVIKDDGLVSLAELPVVDQSQSISSIKAITLEDVIAPKSDEPQAERAEEAAAVTDAAQVQEHVAAVSEPVITPEDKTAPETETVPESGSVMENGIETVSSTDPEPVKAEETQEEQGRCYYVLITHTKTYPAVGSRVIMRLCDNEYVWTDAISEDQKPSFEKCPKCGKEVAYTETEMD